MAVFTSWGTGCGSFRLAHHRNGDDALGPRSAATRFDSSDPLQRQAAAHPLEFLKMCRDRYAETVRDYRCRFTMQERLRGVLMKVEETQIRFREEPFSVDMYWVRNPPQAQRVSYVAGRWRRDDREYALVELSGVLALLAPNGVKRNIHAPDMVAAARGTIDQFGFKNTLDSIIEDCESAQDHPEYELSYVGTDALADRPCLVFRRLLPYDGPGGPYPERLTLIYIDREWLLPTGCFAYADEARETLLGAYVTTDVEFNVGLGDDDF